MKIFNIIIGCFFISLFLFFIVIYLNLFVIGYTFLEFVYFIIRSHIIWLGVLGLFLIYKGTRVNKNELLLRFKTKFSKK